jgi:GH15 family glucan-1,4-alpha-glucosidase
MTGFLGDDAKVKEYLAKAAATITPDGKIPELYFSNSEKPNENTPLGWSESMYVAVLYKVNSLYAFSG